MRREILAGLARTIAKEDPKARVIMGRTFELTPDVQPCYNLSAVSEAFLDLDTSPTSYQHGFTVLLQKTLVARADALEEALEASADTIERILKQAQFKGARLRLEKSEREHHIKTRFAAATIQYLVTYYWDADFYKEAPLTDFHGIGSITIQKGTK